MDDEKKKSQNRLKSNSWGSVHAACPFWRGETDRAICCEGVREGETIRRMLPDKEAKHREMLEYCCKDYKLCKIFQLVYGGYQ